MTTKTVENYVNSEDLKDRKFRGTIGCGSFAETKIYTVKKIDPKKNIIYVNFGDGGYIYPLPLSLHRADQEI